MRLIYLLIYFTMKTSSLNIREDSEGSMSSLPKPVLRSWYTLEHGFVMTWDPVVGDEANPILGFKLKVWLMAPNLSNTPENLYETIVNGYENVDYDVFSTPDEPTFVKYALGGATSAEVVGAEPGASYQVRVQAYSAAGDGPLSDAIRLPQTWDHEYLLHGQE